MNQFRFSFEWLEKHFKASGNFDSQLLTRATGITATEAQAVEIQEAIKDPNINYLNSRMTRAFAKELTSISATGWSSNSHTAENVELLAMGPGSEQVPGFIQNYELFGLMTDALGI
jgi:alkaline phosphatase